MKNSELLKTEWFKIFNIPNDLILVDDKVRERNNRNVRVLRFQKKEPMKLGKPHATFVIGEMTGNLISYNSFIMRQIKINFSEKQAVDTAIKIFQMIVPEYYKALRYVRTDMPERKFIDVNGKSIIQNIYWVKFIHQNGSYSWIGFAQDGTIEEFEIDSRWDFYTMRRGTEMWFHDDWVKAFKGEGPQMNRPNALAINV
ncbi:YcdB/YcdC domain-containing protein [Elizabethkingia ursingii]|uniref:YcdB/YcdC domain-containing protein n=1 Tax=Elizabethkingia ursingii TaxID=1756150 RepID=UPI000750A0BF|nr:YcdB/YcdC domain-containing protein [Elizabethkingia ursingii]KUY30362.1 hypothetical protein ATB96_01560 [Elizabethkingia ursingii]